MKRSHTDAQFAAAYIRVSTDDQTEYSPSAQRRAIDKYAKANGYVLTDKNVFIDEGISGRKAEKRPAFMRMIATAKSKEHPFDVILVHKFDRFARSREDSVVYKSLLRKECGVKVISITESIEDDKFSIILEAMLEAMGEYYSINLSDEVKKGMNEKHLMGGLQNGAPFGYRVENNMLVPSDEHADIVRHIFDWFLDGQGYSAISRKLNDMGVKTYRGNAFENRGIEYIIRNPVYIGKLRRSFDGKVRREFDSNKFVVVDSKHEPLIPIEVWEEAQKRVYEVKAKHRYSEKPITSKKDWISGMVRCAACGKTLVVQYPYWKCNGYVHGACHSAQNIHGDILKAAIKERLLADATSDVLIDYNVVHRDASETALKMNLAAKEKIEKKIARLREAYLVGGESAEEYKQMKDLLVSDLDEINAEIESARSKKNDNVPELKQKIESVLRIITSTSASIEKKHDAFNDIVDYCLFDKREKTLKIHYRFIL